MTPILRDADATAGEPSAGYLYVANSGSVTAYKVGTQAVLRTVTAKLSHPGAVAIDPAGNFYVADLTGAHQNTVSEYALGQRAPKRILSGLALCCGNRQQAHQLALDGSGNLYVANAGGCPPDNTVNVYAPGQTSPSRTITLPSTECKPFALLLDDRGDLYVITQTYGPYKGYPGHYGSIYEYSPGATSPSRTIPDKDTPTAMALDSAENLYVVDSGNLKNGGDAGVSVYVPGKTTPKRRIKGLRGALDGAVDASGNLYVADSGDNVVKVYAPRSTSVLRRLPANYPDALAFDPSGNLYVANDGNSTVEAFAPGSARPFVTITSGVNQPLGIAIGSAITVDPSDLSLLVDASASVAISERLYTGSITGASAGAGACDRIASWSPSRGTGPEFNVKITGLAPGSCSIAFTDGNRHSTTLSVTVHPISEFTIPTANSYPAGIAVGSDRALWFTEGCGNKIGRITTTGTITEYPIPPSKSGYGNNPFAITSGPDGNLWFTELAGGNIGRITTAGAITEFPIPPSGNGYSTSPNSIAPGPDGALWFTAQSGGNIGRITTSGTITLYPIATSGSYYGSFPAGIAAGPDGALWFTQGYGNWIGKITTSGALTKFPIPAANGYGSYPAAIAAGPDGALWFVEEGGGLVGRITTAGSVTTFAIGTKPGSADYPEAITAGPASALWFTEGYLGKIGEITTGGDVTQYAIPSGGSTNSGYGSYPNAIVDGPDGALWFTEGFGNRIGRLRLGLAGQGNIRNGRAP